MNKLLFFFLLCIGQAAFGQNADSSLGKPLFWYTVSNPRHMFVGAEGPAFVLYDSGKVLFNRKGSYWLVQISEQEKEELISELHLGDTIFNKDQFLNAIDPKNEIVCCDHFTYTFSALRDTASTITVLGSLEHSRFRNQLPSSLLAANDVITSFTADDATPWLPDRIEVLLSKYSHARGETIPWPKEWPDLNSSPATSQHGEVTSLYLDSQYFRQLGKLLKKRKSTQAFEISGRKYFVGYRFPIPGLW